jgi:palmitoyltransferase
MHGTPDEKIDTISKACAYGHFDKLKAFIEADPSCVNQPDEQGYFPLQWAALNNRVVETNYLLNQSAAVNARDSTGQTALHWAAVRGSLTCIETLLRNGADPAIADNRGYSPCHVAAQYGQTAVLYHLAVKWGVDCDTTGVPSRVPLLLQLRRAVAVAPGCLCRSLHQHIAHSLTCQRHHACWACCL